MNLTPDLKDTRLTVSAAAELAGMHPAHFRRLVRQGVFPRPKQTAAGRPFFDHDLLVRIAEILRTGVGANGREVMFYRKAAAKTARNPVRPKSSPRRQSEPDAYLSSLAAALRQLGFSNEELTPRTLIASLESAFGQERPELSAALPVLCRHLSADK